MLTVVVKSNEVMIDRRLNERVKLQVPKSMK